MKFLVVDDSSTMRRIVVNSLQRIGFTDTVEAGDGQEALEQVRRLGAVRHHRLEHAQHDRDRAGRALRERGEQVPILMVTARSVREDIIEAMEAGVNNYIVKPFTPQILKEKIDALMSVASAG
jgi:two-component system chemotaxis response regulator CheY